MNEAAKCRRAPSPAARDLRDWNFNVNLGPVVDVDVNPGNPIIGALGRSFSGDPGTVTAYAGAFVRGHRASGVLTALKHFPGHSSSSEDSHKGFVDITDTWTPAELEPYRALVADGLVDRVITATSISGGSRSRPKCCRQACRSLRSTCSATTSASTA